MKKLLVVGSTGLVGSKIPSIARKHGWESYNTKHVRSSSQSKVLDLDITDQRATLAMVDKIRPDVIINTAAITNVDYCEAHKEEARKVNVEGVNNLVEAASRNSCRLVQISTDFVFNGLSGPYTENDTPAPIQYYGKTKLEAEKIVSRLPSYAIARPSVIYGWNPQHEGDGSTMTSKPMNFAMFVLDKLRRNEKVKAVIDQYSSPTFADNLAEILVRLAGYNENGMFHTAGRSCLSRYEFACKLASIFEYDPGLIESVLSSEFKQVARRPSNSCLRVEKTERELGIRLLTAEEGISEMRSQIPLFEPKVP